MLRPVAAAHGAWERLAGLALEVEGWETAGLQHAVAPAFTRRSTVVLLRGGGEEGAGEDVTYEAGDAAAFQEQGPRHDLAGRHTLGSFSRRLDELDLFTRPPRQEAARDYRRWAFESAALDLALRQARTSLAAVLGQDLRPLHFVSSMGLGEPPRLEPLLAWRAACPGLKFKLDAGPGWDRELLEGLAATGAVEVVDLKGFYTGTPVDLAPDPQLYAAVAAGLPAAWIEDPRLTPDTDAVLRPHRERVTWDAPIHSVADITALPFPPRCLNMKPSRFGSLQRLFAAYAHCAQEGIAAYGGGQFELGPGRGQCQLLAAIFHPDAPNDLAPRAFNAAAPQAGLPPSPLALQAGRGFRTAG